MALDFLENFTREEIEEYPAGKTSVILSSPLQVCWDNTDPCQPVLSLEFSDKYDETVIDCVGFKAKSFQENGKFYLAIERKGETFKDLFLDFVCTILNSMRLREGTREKEIFKDVIKTIDSWTTFLKKASHKWTEEKELGLLGELAFLNEYLEAGESIEDLIEFWLGPVQSSTDFIIDGRVGVEVKASTEDSPFKAKINSLQQLDEKDLEKLFLCTVKFTKITNPEEEGFSIYTLGKVIEKKLANAILVGQFRSLLIASGYLDDIHREKLQRYKLDYSLIFNCSVLPRLTVNNVPVGITRARYEIVVYDKDLLSSMNYEKTEYFLERISTINLSYENEKNE